MSLLWVIIGGLSSTAIMVAGSVLRAKFAERKRRSPYAYLTPGQPSLLGRTTERPDIRISEFAPDLGQARGAQLAIALKTRQEEDEKDRQKYLEREAEWIAQLAEERTQLRVEAIKKGKVWEPEPARTAFELYPDYGYPRGYYGSGVATGMYVRPRNPTVQARSRGCTMIM